MKKIIACISLVFAMSAGVTALADDTATLGDNTDVTVNTEATYNTVLITDPNGEYVYVDQDDTTGFGAASNFLLKAGSTDENYGVYTVKMGSANGASTTMTFEIVDPNAAPEDIAMTPAYTYDTKDGNYDAGFTYAGSLEGYSKLVFTATHAEKGSDTAIFDLPTTFTGEGITDFAVRVVDIPNGVTVALGVTAAEEE